VSAAEPGPRPAPQPSQAPPPVPPPQPVTERHSSEALCTGGLQWVARSDDIRELSLSDLPLTPLEHVSPCPAMCLQRGVSGKLWR
jgi:hypothetical protein